MERKVMTAEEAKLSKKARAQIKQGTEEHKCNNAVNKVAGWLICCLVKSDADHIKVKKKRIQRNQLFQRGR